MKRVFFAIIAFTLILASCSNHVDLYSDSGDSTVVYAMLDASADTNFFKITKSFIGNVYDLAHDYSANNYTYQEIDVTFSGVFEGSNNTQTFTLDTISKWIPAQLDATFYNGCWQTYYYTDKKLKEGEKYTLNIYRKADSLNITTQATTINSFSISKPFLNQIIQFKDAKRGTVEWRVSDPETMFKSTAAYFTVTGFFHYKELMPGATDTVYRSIQWNLGSGEADALYNTTDRYYVISYTPKALYDVLASNEYLKNNSPIGVKRWYEKFEYKVSAIGDELYNYSVVNNSSSAIQDTPNFTNVENGVGLMSSRVSRSSFHRINQTSRQKIEDDFPQYGFVHDPNP